MKLVIGNFEKIVFGNRYISLASYGKIKMFVDGHLELSKDGVAIFVDGRMLELELCKVGSNLLHKRGP
jgi:hypothetical protein